ncbi:hypothetical protein KA005_73015 [bacterium]|nr:hypothetical protein [bacterium]
MEEKQNQKLTRYFMNASKFIWGLPRRKQSDAYDWLRRKGYEFQNGTYSYVISQLKENPGIEKILKDIVMPEVRNQFPQGFLDSLHEHWNNGRLPDMSFLDTYKMKQADPFLEVGGYEKFRYIDRWGDLAPIYFEEISPWIEESETKNERKIHS